MARARPGWLDEAWVNVSRGSYSPSGQWISRNWRGVPGPLFLTKFTTIGIEKRSLTPHIARDRRNLPYFWRQPRDHAELVDVLSNWPRRYFGNELGIDGDDHWTLEMIRAWWSLRDEIGTAYRASGIPELGRYMEHELPEYLRSYAFFIVEGRRPTASDVLPEIDVPHAVTIAPPTASFDGSLELLARQHELIADRGLHWGELPFWGERELEEDASKLDVPGLFAVAASCSIAPDVASNVCVGPAGAFVFRQPSSPRELERMLDAGVAHPLTFQLRPGVALVSDIRRWWKTHHEAVRAALAAGGVRDADAYVDGELATYLRGLMFLSQNGHLAGPDDELPSFVYGQPPPVVTSLVLCDPRELPVEIPWDRFGGHFAERSRLNVPGMFYGADTDTCGTGPIEAQDNVALDENGQEFVFCQPFTKRELKEVVSAANVECFSGYGIDGNDEWTVELVRAWWAERDTIREAWRVAEVPDVDARFEHDVPQWLRMFMFYLVNKRPLRAGDELPEL